MILLLPLLRYSLWNLINRLPQLIFSVSEIFNADTREITLDLDRGPALGAGTAVSKQIARSAGIVGGGSGTLLPEVAQPVVVSATKALATSIFKRIGVLLN
jgi:hypothetical protein